MLAVISQEPINIKYFVDFRQLAKNGKVAKGGKPGHSDGWGLLAYIDGSPTYFGRKPTDAYTDSEYEKACKALEEKKINGVVFAQLRKRSVGRRDLVNTPPIVSNNLSYMHNGTVHNLGNEIESDSRQLLKMIVQETGKNSILDSLRIVYSQISKSHRYTSLTSVLSDGNSIFATKCSDTPQDSEYYNLMYARSEDNIVVSQERTWQLNWTTIKNGEVAVISPDLDVSVEELFKSKNK